MRGLKLVKAVNEDIESIRLVDDLSKKRCQIAHLGGGLSV